MLADTCSIPNAENNTFVGRKKKVAIDSTDDCQMRKTLYFCIMFTKDIPFIVKFKSINVNY